MPLMIARMLTPATLVAAASLATAAPTPAQVLTAVMAAPITTVDPHFYNSAPNNGLALHIYERLVERSPEATLLPGLAASWTPVPTAVDPSYMGQQ